MNSLENREVEIEFLYFSGCPNSEPTLSNLNTALSEMRINAEPLVLEVDPATFDQPFPGSPSIIVNGIDLYNLRRPDAFEYACRTFDIGGETTGVLSVGFIRERLAKILNTDARQAIF